MAIKDTTIWVKAQNQPWQALGVETARGVWAEDVQLVSDQGGPKSAQFTLRRDGRESWPDIVSRTRVDVEVAGVRVWSGRVKETPSRDGADMAVTVSCEGWQAHLDDLLYSPFYVQNGLGDYKDMRSISAIPIATFGLRQGLQVSNDNGAITVSIPQGTPLIAGNNRVGVLLDLGVFNASAYIMADLESSNNAATVNFIGGATNNAALATGSDAFNITLAAGPSGSNGGAVVGRYVYLYLTYSSGATTAGADHWIKIRAVRVFGSTAYQSGGASILKAPVVIKDALAQSTTELSSDLSEIDPAAAIAFNIPALAPGGPQTPRMMVDAVNAYHNWLFKIDEYRRPVYRARSIFPAVKVGAGVAFQSEDSSANSSDDVYDTVWLSWQTPEGIQAQLVRTGTAPLHQAKELQIQSTLPADGVAAAQIGDTWLAAHSTTPFKGTATITGTCEHIMTGGRIQPERLLLMTGELMRFDDRVDPDTGATVRDGRIAEVTYTPATDASQITIDDSRTDVDALLARLAVVTGGS